MRVFLLYPNQDFKPSRTEPSHSRNLVEDLGLEVVFQTMARGDEFLLDVARQLILTGEEEVSTILYRQDIMRDCIQNPQVVKDLYQIPLEFLERKRQHWLWISERHSTPSSVLGAARRMLEVSLDLLRKLREMAERHASSFSSEGFLRFFNMIKHELDDSYLNMVEEHIRMLRFPHGVIFRVRLGKGNEGTGYSLCKPKNSGDGWLQRFFDFGSHSYSYRLHPRDDTGARILGELRDRGLARAARAVAQAALHVESFFKVLRQELAFYIGGLNLYEELTSLGEPVAFPEPSPFEEFRLQTRGLYDASLALTMRRKVIGNDLSANGKSLILITGPNRGGKTTFLRALGIAQLMMQCGIFVAAQHFDASLCKGVFTHFKREEDKKMEAGKFEEELIRMSSIVDNLNPYSMLLLNESFSATNEREGSEIARQMINVFLERRIKVCCVTHFYELARHYFENRSSSTIFLRGERLPDGARTFKFKEGRPSKTGYGADLYEKVFGVKGT